MSGAADLSFFLTPGAGSNREHPCLVEIEKQVAPLAVQRFDFRYRQEGRRFPDRAPKLVAEVNEAVTAWGVDPQRLVLGGRSMGGRICSMAVAEGLPAAGLVLICYPLHPVKKPETLRVDHFGDLQVPCLFISGDRDEFGTPDEFDQHLHKIPGPVTRVILEGKRHDLKGADETIAATVADWLVSLPNS